MEIDKKKHPADKYNITPKEHIQSVRDEAFKNRIKIKKVKVVYKQIKSNMAMLQKVNLLETSELLDARGKHFNSAEEEIFKIIMIGDKTDDYPMKVEIGDLVMITNFATHIHLPETEAKTINGDDASYYLVVSLNDIAAIVEYSKI